jgi:hypothetical protein
VNQFLKNLYNLLFICLLLTTYTLKGYEFDSDTVLYSEAYPDPYTLSSIKHDTVNIPRWKDFKSTIIRQALFLLNLYPDDTLLVYGRDGEIIYDALKHLNKYVFRGTRKIHLINFSRRLCGSASFNRETYKQYLSQFNLNTQSLENNKRFILVDTGFAGNLQKYTIRMFDTQYNNQFSIELMNHRPIILGLCSSNLKVPHSRFALMPLESFIPYVHPFINTGNTKLISECLPHTTETAYEIGFNSTTNLFDTYSMPMSEEVIHEVQIIREDLLHTIDSDIKHIKQLSDVIRKTIKIYQSLKFSFPGGLFLLKKSLNSLFKTYPTYKLDIIALIQDLDERFPDLKKKEFFQNNGVFFTDPHNIPSEEGFTSLPAEKIFNDFPAIKNSFIYALIHRKYDEIDRILHNLKDLTYFYFESDDLIPEPVRHSKQLIALKETLAYFEGILTPEELVSLRENTLIKSLLEKHNILE